MEADQTRWGGFFDIVFMEGGLHYFHDLPAFMGRMEALLQPGGRMICSDFHPFQKVADILGFQTPAMDYFSTAIVEGEMVHARFYPPEIRAGFPKCRLRRYTLSEIINAVLEAGSLIRRFDEHPAWTDSRLPGEFTLLADKP